MAMSYAHANPEKHRLLDDVQIRAFFEAICLSVVVVQASHSAQQVGRLTQEFRAPRAQQLRGRSRGVQAAHREETPDYANLVEHGTGVFIKDGGFILTCQHVIDGYDTLEIRTYDEFGFHAVELVHQDKCVDLALLRLSDYRAYDQRYVELSADKSVSLGMQLISIHDSYSLPSSMGMGEVAYPCSNIETIFDDRNCIDFTRTCRLDRDLVDINEGEVVDPLLSGIDRSMRVVQISNLHAYKGGSGAPLFDSRGHLVALYFAMVGYMDFGIHVYHIRQFMDDADAKARCTAKGKGLVRPSKFSLGEKTRKKKKERLSIGG